MNRVLVLAAVAAFFTSGCLIIKTHDHEETDRRDAIYDQCDSTSATTSGTSCDLSYECKEGRYLLRCNFAVGGDGEARGYFCECIESGQIVRTFESADVCEAQSMEQDARTFCRWYLD